MAEFPTTDQISSSVFYISIKNGLKNDQVTACCVGKSVSITCTVKLFTSADALVHDRHVHTTSDTFSMINCASRFCPGFWILSVEVT